MKVSVYMGGGVSSDVNFRWIGVRAGADGDTVVFDGFHTANSTESKATVELDFDEAMELIEDLKAQLAEMPCPTCRRHA